MRHLTTGILLAAMACSDAPAGPGAGPPARMTVLAGDGQRGLAGSVVPTPVRVLVADAGGRAVPGVRVAFTTDGGSQLGGDSAATTGDDGVVVAPAWRLGKAAMPQSLRVTAGTVALTVTATIITSFDPQIRFVGAVAPADRDRVLAALARIRGLVTGDLPEVNATRSGIDLNECGVPGQPPLDEVIEDVVVFTTIRAMDGPGGVLASAGPCLIRTGTSPSTVVGVMTFDAADLVGVLRGEAFVQVVIHELIHVLGFGTLWPEFGLVAGGGTPDPRYTGPLGHHGCLTTAWSAACENAVPLEAGGGTGTALSHWRELVFDRELLTGYYAGGDNVLSLMTAGAMEDLGFVVNDAAADVSTGPGAVRAGARAFSPDLVAGERLRRPVRSIGPDGRLSPTLQSQTPR